MCSRFVTKRSNKEMKNRSATWWPQKENAKRPRAAVGGVALDNTQQKKKRKRPEPSTTPRDSGAEWKYMKSDLPQEGRSCQQWCHHSETCPFGRHFEWMKMIFTLRRISALSLTFFLTTLGGCVSAASFLLRFQRQPPDSAGATRLSILISDPMTCLLFHHWNGICWIPFSRKIELWFQSFLIRSLVVGHLAATNGVIFEQSNNF